MFAALATIACRPAPGTHPDDMSVAGHEQAAVEAETAAAQQEAKYDPNASAMFDGPDCVELCFRANPTESHLTEARQLRREAAAHRDASHALRVAEERACADVPEIHRDFSPFYHVGHITGAELDGDGPVVVHFDPIPKTSPQSLQRLVDCHVARNAALGYEVDEMAFCPLAIAGIAATVVATDAGFDIEIEADTSEALDEARARVERLLPQ